VGEQIQKLRNLAKTTWAISTYGPAPRDYHEAGRRSLLNRGPGSHGAIFRNYLRDIADRLAHITEGETTQTACKDFMQSQPIDSTTQVASSGSMRLVCGLAGRMIDAGNRVPEPRRRTAHGSQVSSLKGGHRRDGWNHLPAPLRSIFQRGQPGQSSTRPCGSPPSMASPAHLVPLAQYPVGGKRASSLAIQRRARARGA